MVAVPVQYSSYRSFIVLIRYRYYTAAINVRSFRPYGPLRALRLRVFPPPPLVSGVSWIPCVTHCAPCALRSPWPPVSTSRSPLCFYPPVPLVSFGSPVCSPVPLALVLVYRYLTQVSPDPPALVYFWPLVLVLLGSWSWCLVSLTRRSYHTGTVVVFYYSHGAVWCGPRPLCCAPPLLVLWSPPAVGRSACACGLAFAHVQYNMHSTCTVCVYV
jgi:hypothetical protein